MDRYSQYSAMILTMLMFFFTLLAHWLACVWFVIAERERAMNRKEWDLGESLVREATNHSRACDGLNQSEWVCRNRGQAYDALDQS